MKIIKTISAIFCAVCCISGCSNIRMADVNTITVEPYRSVSEENVRFEECSIQFGDEVSISGQGAWYKGNDIVISEGGIYKISGDYNGGCIKVDTSNAVKLIFSNANISNPDGYAVDSAAERLIIETDGVNTLTGSGGEAKTAVSSDGTMLILGIGDMTVNGGVFSRGGIKFGREVSTICEIIRTEAGDFICGTLNLK